MNQPVSTRFVASLSAGVPSGAAALNGASVGLSPRRPIRLGSVLALAVTLALGACGGGADDLADAPLAASGAASPGTTVEAGAGGANVGDASGATTAALPADTSCGNDQMQAQLIAGINALRARAQSCGSEGAFGATTALAWNRALFSAAAGHSTDMAVNNYFSHVSPAGRTMQDRVDAAGYAWTALAENIAAGQTSVSSVLSAWMNSPGHCANIMGSAYRDVGLSCVANGSGKRYWTLNFGRPRD